MRRMDLAGFHAELVKAARIKNADHYASASGQEQSQFVSQITFSYWEYVKGINRTVIGDSSIPGRYHIVSDVFNEGGNFIGTHYQMVQGPKGDVITSWGPPISEKLKGDTASVISFYEKVRSLKRFDPKHPLLVEFQTTDRGHIFLQAHRTRDFKKAPFQLSRSPREDEIVAEAVRGATNPEGLEVELVFYPLRKKVSLDPSEVAVCDVHAHAVNLLALEIAASRRQLQVINNQASRVFGDFGGHISQSAFFKPEISLVFPFEELLGNRIPRKITRYRVRVYSDGIKAYVSLVTP